MLPKCIQILMRQDFKTDDILSLLPSYFYATFFPLNHSFVLGEVHQLPSSILLLFYQVLLLPGQPKIATKPKLIDNQDKKRMLYVISRLGLP